MKLHLPTGLRAALLAVFSIVSTAVTTGTASANEPFQLDRSAARYGYQVKTDALYVDVPAGGGTTISYPSMQESWVLSVEGIFFPENAKKDTNKDSATSAFTGGCVMIGNVQVPMYEDDIADDKVRKPSDIKKNQFAIYISNKRDIYVVTSRGAKKVCETVQFLLSQPLKVTLNWVYDEEKEKGSLYLLAVDAVKESNNPNMDNPSSIFINDGNFYAEKYTILKDVSLTEEDMKAYGGLFTTAVSDTVWQSKFVQTTYSAGSGSDPKAWLITGYTDIEQMMNTRTYGKKYAAGDTVQFTGSNGALIYTGNSTYEYNITDTIATNNILMGDMLTSVGFGAWNEGAKLIVKEEVLADRALTSAGINVIGEGTLKLELGSNPGGDDFKISSMEAGSTLEISNTAYNGKFEIDLTESKIGTGASIIRTADSTAYELSFNLDDKEKEVNYYNFNTLKNENGSLLIYAGNVEKSESGKIKSVTHAQLDVDTLSATTGSINLYGGVINVNNIESKNSILVGLSGAYGGRDYLRTTLNVKNTLTTDGTVTVNGSAHLGNATASRVNYVYNSDINNTLTANSIKTKAINIDFSDEEHPMLDASNADLPIIPATVSIESTDKSLTELVKGGFAVKVSETSATITAGSISNSKINLEAGQLEEEIPNRDGTTYFKTHKSKTSSVVAANVENINFSYTLATDPVLNANDYYDWTYTTTDVLESASGQSVQLSSAGIAAATMSAEKVSLPHDDFSMMFGKLTVKEILDTPASKYHRNVSMEGVTDLKSNALTAAKVEAEAIELSDNFTFNSSSDDILAQLTAKDTIYVGKGSSLNNVEITTGQGLTLNDDTTLTNAKLSGWIMTDGKITFEQAGFSGKGSIFGGATGDDFVVDKAKAGIEGVIMNAELDGDYLSISSMDLFGEELEFSNEGTTYEVLSANSGAVDYEVKPSNSKLFIQPWVRARIEMTDGAVTINGREDMAGIKEELCTSDNRTATIGAINELDAKGAINPQRAIENDKSPLAAMHDYIGHIHRYSQAEREEVLSAISGASFTALADSQRRGVMDVQNNVRNRVIQMGGAARDNNSDWDYLGLQAWAQADGSFASISGNGDNPGYNYNSWGATVGANIELSESTVVGISCSASYGDVDVDGADHATGSSDAQYVSLYARYQSNRWVQMLILTAGQNDMDLKRNVLGYTGKGSTDGTSLSAYYEAGYTMGLNYDYTHILQPLFSVRITKADIDGYTEGGNIGNAAITYDGSSLVYGSVSIGARYQGVIYTSAHERNAVAEARVQISQDFGDSTDEAKVALGQSSMYKVNGADTFGTSLELGAGLSIPLQQHTTLFADADLSVSGDYNSFRANIGLRYDF